MSKSKKLRITGLVWTLLAIPPAIFGLPSATYFALIMGNIWIAAGEILKEIENK